MKILYKLVIISLLFISVDAKEKINKEKVNKIGNELKIYESYADFLVNYTIELPEKIENPFMIPKIKKYKKVEIKIKKPQIKKIKKENKPRINLFERELNIKLLSVFIMSDNKKALLQVNGRKKWVKENEIIAPSYKLEKIIDKNTILVSHNNRTKIINIRKNNLNIKVIK